MKVWHQVITIVSDRKLQVLDGLVHGALSNWMNLIIIPVASPINPSLLFQRADIFRFVNPDAMALNDEWSDPDKDIKENPLIIYSVEKLLDNRIQAAKAMGYLLSKTGNEVILFNLWFRHKGSYL